MTPLAEPVVAPTGESLLTKTSLARYNEVKNKIRFFCLENVDLVFDVKQETQRIGSAHNTKAAPFTPSVKVFFFLCVLNPKIYQNFLFEIGRGKDIKPSAVQLSYGIVQ